MRLIETENKQENAELKANGALSWAAHLKSISLEGISNTTVDAHLRYMPDSFWGQVDEPDLIWSLELVQRFLRRAETLPANTASVEVDWRHCPERAVTKVMVCEWDRWGLLAKIAASFCVLRLSVVRVDAYTRGDGLILDVFEVRETERSSVAAASKLQRLAHLINQQTNEPSINSMARDYQRQWDRGHVVGMTPWIQFQYPEAGLETVVRVEASDRPGLWQDLLLALMGVGYSINHAKVEADGEVAQMEFRFCDPQGTRQQPGSRRIQELWRDLMRACLGEKTSCDSVSFSPMRVRSVAQR